MSESEENDENTPPVYVLLPVCIESNTDVFLHVLRSIVLRTRLYGYSHLQSMMSGMTGEIFEVDINDLSVDWRKLTSNPKQEVQSKLLGFWACRHYPLICKKLMGAAWQPPEECSVRVREAVEMGYEEIDNIVSKKMELRLIEMTVCKSTLSKLSCFVLAPVCIGRLNVTSLSSKMNSFQIDTEYLADCWQALKDGGFPSNFEQRNSSTSTIRAPQNANIRSHLTIDQDQIIRRSPDQSTVEKRNSGQAWLSDAMLSSNEDILMSPCNVLLTGIGTSTSKNAAAVEPTIVPTAKRARRVSPTSTTINFDALRVAVSEIRDDIRNLTKCVEVNIAKNNNESFHLAVFKQKDAEILKLKESIQQDKDEKLKLYGEIETKSNLISALQNVVETSSKLHAKMEEESIAMVQLLADTNKLKTDTTEKNDKLQKELATVEHRLAYFDSEKQNLLEQLSAANQLNCELKDTTGKLQEELNAAKNHSAEVVQKLFTAEQVNIKLTEAKGKLQEHLYAAGTQFANMESDMKRHIQELVHKLSAGDKTNIELTDANGKLRQELDSKNVELKENERLGETIQSLKVRMNSLMEEFKTRVEGADKVNAQLQEKLNILKQKQKQASDEDVSIKPCDELQTDSDINALPSEPVKHGGNVTVKPNALNKNQDSFWEKEFVSEDKVVQECRSVLMQQTFGWMKFQNFKNSKFCPAFVYSVDADGIQRAQKVKRDGWITDTKSIFWEFRSELADNEKQPQEVLALKKFNHRFGSNFK